MWAESAAELEPAAEGHAWRLSRAAGVAPGQLAELTVWWGLGLEGMSAVTSAREMQRRGWDWELRRSLAWLVQRSLDLGDEALTRLYNTNLFFCIFFSTGRTLDTEELVLVTSRSPRYYVSAAYWDRDSLLWSFPAVLDADAALAREMLGYVFGRQRRNIGVHSRFIDGTVLEPGFELDELMAPVLALERYVDATGDRSVLADPDVLRGIDGILKKLDAERAEDCELYETFLQPTDDERVYPYITYDNVLVWRALRALGRLFERPELTERAERVRRAIYDNCIFDGAFAWSVDLAGGNDVYDEPPGSLLLLPYYGFCAWDDPVYLKTAAMIRSPDYAYSFAGCEIAEIGCPHAPHPWLLSIGNSLLCGRSSEALEHLRRRAGAAPGLPVSELFTGSVHNRLGRLLIKYADVEAAAPLSAPSERELRTVAAACKRSMLRGGGTEGVANAQVPAGGIRTSEFDPRTRGSRLCPRLVACGEVRDIDGDCGGYNLQWAWSSGVLAGHLGK